MEYALGGPGEGLLTPSEVAAAFVERARIASSFVTSKLTEWRNAVTDSESVPAPETFVTEAAIGVGAMTTYIGKWPKVSKTDAAEGMSGKDQVEQSQGDVRIRGSRRQASSADGRTSGTHRGGDDIEE